MIARIVIAATFVLSVGSLRADPLDGKLDDCQKLMDDAAQALRDKNYAPAIDGASDASACFRGKVSLLTDLAPEWVAILQGLADYAMAWSHLARFEETRRCEHLDQAEDQVVSARELITAAAAGPRLVKLQNDLKALDKSIQLGRKKCDE